MFDITLYTVKEDARYLNKTLSSYKTITNCFIKENTDIINPIITIECSLDDIVTKNYMYIPNFQRYYFITNISSISANLCEITAKVDVLMTYNEEVKDLEGFLSRQEYSYNDYLFDEKYPISQINDVVTVPFPNKSDQEQYVLIVGSDVGTT